jgi:nitrogenase subunit NifH
MQQDTHSGSYSNKTIENILKESPLVEMYRKLGKMIEKNFSTTKKTTKHQGPGMKKTFHEILSLMEKNGTHVMEQGCESEFTVNRNLEKGLESIQQTAKDTEVGRAGVNESENMQGLEAGGDDGDLDEEDLMLDDE